MPLIKDGAQSVEELRQRAHDLGLVMDDLAVAKGDLLSDTLDDLSFTAKGLGRIFGSEMHAPMINISKVITDVLARISTWSSFRTPSDKALAILFRRGCLKERILTPLFISSPNSSLTKRVTS